MNNLGSSVLDAKLNVQNIVNTFFAVSYWTILEKHLDMKGIIQNLLEFTKRDNHNHGACVMPNSNRCVLSPPTYIII